MPKWNEFITREKKKVKYVKNSDRTIAVTGSVTFGMRSKSIDRYADTLNSREIKL